MLADSSNVPEHTSEGSRAALIAPVCNITQPVMISFMMYMHLEPSDNMAALDIIVTTEMGLPVQSILKVSGDQGDTWREYIFLKYMLFL